MIDLEEILGIVDTYDLTENQRDIVLRNTLKRQAFFEDYSKAYDYISNFVEYLNIPFQERRNISLDDTIGDSKTPISHFLGKWDNIVFEKDELYRKNTILQYSNQYLGNLFDDEILDFFNYLVINTSLEPEEYKSVLESINDFHDIQNRLKLLKSYIYDKDEDNISREDLTVTSFSPFKVAFRNRKYGGNPLKFFQDNKELYGGMSRKELERFDSGLERHLRIHGQMEQAIPEIVITNSLKKRDIDRILNSYDDSYGCANISSEKLGFHPHTIRKYWKENELKLYRKPWRFKENPLIYFKRNKHKFKDMTRSEFREKHPGFCKYLSEKGMLEEAIPDIFYHKKLNEKDIKNIISLHKKTKGVLKHASEISGHATQTIAKYWQEKGLHEIKEIRDYGGDPLAYFFKHKELYEGMTRSEFALFDKGLYGVLWREGLLDKAIPK